MRRLLLVVARVVYRASLLACPRVFRHDFGAEATATFDLTARAAARLGLANLARVTALAVNDSITVALTRRRVLRAPLPTLGRATHPRSGLLIMQTLLSDLRIAARMLTRRPAFALTAIATLALGIGANAAIFSVVDHVLLRPLPYPAPERLVQAYWRNSEQGTDRGRFSYPDLADWETSGRGIDALGLYSTLPSGPLMTGGEEPLELEAAYVTRGFFETLGREALHGRTLLPAEERGDNLVVVLSHGFWQRRFGGDPSIVGESVTLDDAPYRVAGVMPPDFAFPDASVEAWLFLTVIPESSIPYTIPQVRFLDGVMRLAPGVTVAEATADLGAVAATLARERSDTHEGLDGVALVPLSDSLTASVGRPLLILLAGVGVVLLIACVNVASLMLARSSERRSELAVRAALGAARGRLVRQLLTESALLSLLGTTVGLALAWALVPALMARSSGLLPRAAQVGVDGPVVAFALGLTVLTSLLFGIAPALASSSRRDADAMRSSRGTGSPTSRRSWSALVAAEVALAVVLVIGAGLLVRTLMSLQSVDLGVDTDRLLTVSLTINDARYPERPQYLAAYRAITERLERVHGVEAVGSIRYLPLRNLGEDQEIEFPAAPIDGPAPSARLLQTSPSFFRAAGVPLLAGRAFRDEDTEESPIVALVNRTFSEQLAPGRSLTGETIEVGGLDVEVVGVVGDVRQAGVGTEPEATVYLPQAQNPRRGMAFVIRSAGDPASLIAPVRAAIAEIDPDQPIEQILPMSAVAHDDLARPRFFALLLSGFGALALLLAAVGIYGVVSNQVARRRREIGVRMALGAADSDVVRMVVVQALVPAAIGSTIGLLAAGSLTRLMEGVLHGVTALDPVTFALVPVTLLAAAGVASWVPAMRTVRIDATEALRAD